jgi:hypothetical protein
VTVTQRLDIRAVGEHSDKFLLRTCLIKTTEDEGLYSGEEADLTDGEHSEIVGIEEGKVEEPHREEPETSGTA